MQKKYKDEVDRSRDKEIWEAKLVRKVRSTYRESFENCENRHTM